MRHCVGVPALGEHRYRHDAADVGAEPARAANGIHHLAEQISMSFRSKDPQFKTDPAVIPPKGVREKSGITVVQTGYQHTYMSDRGPDDVKSTIQGMLDKFLDDESPLRPVITKEPPPMNDAGPYAPYVPVAPVQN
jgi:hypothetical protein